MKMKEHGLISMELIDTQKQVSRVTYDKAYAFWQTEWSKTICDLGLNGLSVNISDKFVGADEILVLREGQNIAALALINHLDISLAAYKDISYFKAMPESAMAFLLNRGTKKILISTYNIVGRKYRRRSVGGILLSTILAGVEIVLFEMRPAYDLCMGMPLIASGYHRTLTRLGMKDIPGGNITIHDVKAQFMYLTRDKINLGKYDREIRSFFSLNSLINTPQVDFRYPLTEVSA